MPTPQRDDHSSSPAITRRVQQPTRWPRTGRPPWHSPTRVAPRYQSPPYLVLLRAGFCLPSVLPRTRCALTAPFHPYPPPLTVACRSRRASEGGIFSVPLFRQVALPGRYPAHCPSEFGLSSPSATSQRPPRHAHVRTEDPGLPTVDRSSGRLANCDILIIAYRPRFCVPILATASRGMATRSVALTRRRLA